MDIKQLEAFAYVVENNSFSKTAELLHLTQPTISAHIASLEKELKIKLIIRTTKEIYPSDAGRLLYEYAKKILQLRQEAEEAIQTFSREMRGTISLVASTIPGQYYLPKLLQSFRKNYPDITFNIQMMDSSQVVECVATRGAEIGLCGTMIEAPKCVYKEFAEDRLVIVTPNTPEYQQYLSTGFPVQRIMNETFISRESGSGTRKETELFLQEMGIDPSKLDVAIEVQSTENIKQMVSEGLGIAVLSRSAAENYCQFERLLAFDFESVSLRRKLYLVRHKNGVLSPIAQVFYNFAEEYYAENQKEHEKR